ncbi:MAG: protein kinase, partial [Gammaproteobacteria bacterium]|nr:protein kinase [Gammaproteobacteria bacterium]
RGGYISYDDLLGEVDRILADHRADATWLLATLSEEDAKSPLPVDVCSALRNKLEPLAQKEVEFVNDGERESVSLKHDIEGTQLATAYQPNDLQGPDLGDDTSDAIALGDDDIDLIKGSGDVLNNRFELQQCVGSGGMSAVYKAVDRRKVEADDRHPHVAVKVLNLEFRAHPDSLIALQREAKKCQSLAHPNIVRVYDFDRD